ncbi:MAG: PilZ domain-containing protein [Spirochaetaceae bacterium]|nr:PilZ domain-containing protein [Spirochaetaceae bacterium]
MSTMVQGIEKEFILKALYSEQTPALCIYNRLEYTLKIDKIAKGELFFKPDRAIAGLAQGKRIDLTADYKGMSVVFVVEVGSIDRDRFSAGIPEVIYKDLDRTYMRMSFPMDMQLKFSFLQERYFFPISDDTEAKPLSGDDLLPDDIKDFNEINEKMAAWVKEIEGEYKLVLFKDAKLASLEEQIIAKTGKCLFLPSTAGKFPESDPDAKNRVITINLFTQYLKTIGVLHTYFDSAVTQFIKAKQSKNISADVWVPLRFKEYVIGYIHFWSSKPDGPPLGFEAVKTLYQYANSMVFILKEKAYFEAFDLKDKFVTGQGVDISAGGVQFACSHPYITALLILDSELLVRLITPKRNLNLKARVLRRCEERGAVYLGCHFFDPEPEDVRFLFEYIYGKPFSAGAGKC